jgi:hypothetical protein
MSSLSFLTTSAGMRIAHMMYMYSEGGERRGGGGGERER